MKQKPVLLFYSDPYLRETKAKVIDLEENIVWLDKTIFFLESGGQESDRGWINDIQIVDIREDYGHVLEKQPNFRIGDQVVLRLDWERRYRIMRLHSAAHLVFFAVKEVIGNIEVIGSHISAEKARIDLAFNQSISPLLKSIEDFVNKIIESNEEVIIYESKPGWRIWKLRNWEVPCGGTHVRKTGEIGLVKLKRRNIGKGKERIEIYLIQP